jgi:hypothetical protein
MLMRDGGKMGRSKRAREKLEKVNVCERLELSCPKQCMM